MEIKNPGTISIPAKSTFETIAGQLQASSPYHLYVTDGWLLDFYKSLDEVPRGERMLEDASPSYNHNEFYIRDLETGSLYCVFTPELRDEMLRKNDD